METLQYLLILGFAVLVATLPNHELLKQLLDPPKIGIIGGDIAPIEEHPWMVSVFTGFYSYSTFYCGGFLISPTWVVTAAHCVGDFMYAVKQGSNDTLLNMNNRVLITKYYPHPEYKTTADKNPINDIALLQLCAPMIGSSVSPIKLPDLYDPVQVGSYVNVSGWGLVTTDQENIFLYSVSQPVISLEDCQAAYGGNSLFINETFCVGNKGDFKGICNGDSGGPAEQDGVAIGVASWTMEGCADFGYPTVFTNISYYRAWIKEVSGI